MTLNQPVALLVIATAIGLIAATCYRLHRRRIRAAQCQGIQTLLTLKALLTAIQRHRGLSYGALNGDNAMKAQIPPLEASIRSLVGQLELLARIPLAQDHWAAFCNHWERLQNHNLNLTAENNLTQHNQLILVVLYLFENVADASYLDNEPSDQGGPASVLWRQVLQTAEWLGQARALGTGVIASGVCGSVERIRMSFLRSRIETVAAQVQDQIPDQQLLQQVISTIDRHFLEEDTPSLAANEYFDLASLAIEQVLRQFDDGMQGLALRLGG